MRRRMGRFTIGPVMRVFMFSKSARCFVTESTQHCSYLCYCSIASMCPFWRIIKACIRLASQTYFIRHKMDWDEVNKTFVPVPERVCEKYWRRYIEMYIYDFFLSVHFEYIYSFHPQTKCELATFHMSVQLTKCPETP